MKYAQRIGILVLAFGFALTVFAPSALAETKQDLQAQLQALLKQVEELKAKIAQENRCLQVVTPAKNPTTGECKDFLTPCEVPSGWKKVNSCTKTEEQSITVIFPNGGEKFQQGATHQVKWQSVGIASGSVKITTCMTPASYSAAPRSETRCSLPLTVSNTGLYQLTSGREAEIGDYTVRVEDTTNSAIFDEGDSYFSIIPASDSQLSLVVSPNGGEKWNVGAFQNISWQASSSLQSDQLYLYFLEKNGAGNWIPTVGLGSSPGFHSSYSYYPSYNQVGEKKIRISNNPNEIKGLCLNPGVSDPNTDCPSSSGKVYVFDDSDAPFSIVTTTTAKTCAELNVSQRSYFDICKQYNYDNVCFNRFSGEYQGCTKDSLNDCTINNTNMDKNILCPAVSSITKNLPPVIHSLKGPTSLKVGEAGTWTIQASDPEGGSLAYRIVWGDEPISALSFPENEPFAQTATLTHSYSTAGKFTPRITVLDSQGLSAKASVSVEVKGTAPCLQVVTPAQNPSTGECKLFTSSCLPVGWEKRELTEAWVDSCPHEIKVSVCDLANNPALYTNKTIQVEATVKLVGENYFPVPKGFFLEDGNCQMQISSWAPTSVSTCSPSTPSKDCKLPPTMATYLDKKVKLNGTFEKLPKEEYIDGKWTAVGTYYEITNVKNVSIVNVEESVKNLPPVIHSLKGPTSLKVGETGTWTIQASDPEKGSLTYTVVWGDEPSLALSSPENKKPFTQTTTLTHSYSTAGKFTPKITVLDSQGLSAEASVSVEVKGAAPCLQVITPAKNPTTGECKDFATPCEVPSGWVKVDKCQKCVGAGNSAMPPYNCCPGLKLVSDCLPGAPCPISLRYCVDCGNKSCDPHENRYNCSTDCLSCPQVITPAQNPSTGECKEFPTSCDVPSGWKKVEHCPKPSLTVLSPKGGESFKPGQRVSIKYSTSDFPRPIKVAIQLNKGAVYPNGPFNPVDGNGGIKTGYYPASGSYTWTVPSNIATGNDYSLLIETDYPNTETSMGGAYSNNFSIVSTPVIRPSVTVLSPNGGEEWFFGKTYNITWKAQDVKKAYIHLSSPEGEPCKLAEASAEKETLRVKFTKGQKCSGSTSVIEEGKYKILITTDNPAVSDESDNLFNLLVRAVGSSSWNSLIGKVGELFR
jgi:hypothetical protein